MTSDAGGPQFIIRDGKQYHKNFPHLEYNPERFINSIGSYTRDEPYPEIDPRKIPGYKLEYSVKPEFRARFAQIMFGRLHRTYKKKYDVTYSYYYPGYFHNYEFKRMKKGAIHIKDYPPGLLMKIKPLCNLIRLVEVEVLDVGFTTGEEYWKKHAERNKLTIRWWDNNPIDWNEVQPVKRYKKEIYYKDGERRSGIRSYKRRR